MGNGVETWRGRSHFTAGRGKNASEPVILELRARRHPLRAFRPGQIAAPAFAVLGAKFLLIDEIKAVISAALTFGTFLASAAQSAGADRPG